MKSHGTQRDLLRHCDAELAKAYREAADTERVNPYFTPDERAKRAAHYEREAVKLEARAQPAHLCHLTPEQKRRQASGNTSAKGKKARAASPWNRGPNCNGPNAGASFSRYRGRPAEETPHPRPSAERTGQ